MLLDGDIELNIDIAKKLESVIRIHGKFWVGLESTYRKKLLHINGEKSERKMPTIL